MSVSPQQLKTRAFTLVEMLVVVAIIGLLFALLFPSFGKMMEKAKQETCANNLRQICRAAIMYSNENNGMLVQTTSNGSAWTEVLATYIDKSVVHDNGRIFGVYACPKSSMKAMAGSGGYADYGHNGYANTADSAPVAKAGDWGLDPPHNITLKMIAVSQPSKVMYFADAGTQSLDPNNGQQTVPYANQWGLIFRHGADRNGANGRANIAYIDGHVEALKLSDFNTAPSFNMRFPWNPTATQ